MKITQEQMQALFGHYPLLSKHKQGQEQAVATWVHLNLKEGMSLLTLDGVASTVETHLNIVVEVEGAIPKYVVDIPSLYLEADDGGDSYRPKEVK